MCVCLGRVSELDVVTEEALKHLPSEPYIHYNYANALGKAARYQDSEAHFKKAIQLNPGAATYHANLGDQLSMDHEMQKLQRNTKLLFQPLYILCNEHKNTFIFSAVVNSRL